MACLGAGWKDVLKSRQPPVSLAGPAEALDFDDRRGTSTRGITTRGTTWKREGLLRLLCGSSSSEDRLRFLGMFGELARLGKEKIIRMI